MVEELDIVDREKFLTWATSRENPGFLTTTYPKVSWIDALLRLELWLRATVNELSAVRWEY